MGLVWVHCVLGGEGEMPFHTLISISDAHKGFAPLTTTFPMPSSLVGVIEGHPVGAA